MTEHLILASASPRRQSLLKGFGIAFEIKPADIDETPRLGEEGQQVIKRVAREKAELIAHQHPGDYVLGADTGVLVDQALLGKPSTAQQAHQMLNHLSGRSHEVISAVVLLGPNQEVYEALSVTTVWFATLSPSWIEHYVASGDPMDKAGAYAIQNEAGLFISRIEGSYTNVVGLPLFETGQLLRRAGLWHP